MAGPARRKFGYEGRRRLLLKGLSKFLLELYTSKLDHTEEVFVPHVLR